MPEDPRKSPVPEQARSSVRRRDPQATRARILEAAQRLFAERGYARTGLRDIAELAGVSSALPVSYFATKAGLFEAALTAALDIERITRGDRSEFGRRLVAAVLDRSTPITVPAMIALSIGDAESAAIAQRVAREQMVAPVAAWLGAPHARARAYLIMVISTSFVLFNRHILAEEHNDGPAARGSSAAGLATRWLEQTIQGLVDGDVDTLRAFRNRPR